MIDIQRHKQAGWLAHAVTECPRCEDVGALRVLWRGRPRRKCPTHEWYQKLHDHGMLREYLTWRSDLGFLKAPSHGEGE